MKIEQVKIDDLIPYANNARVHSPEQVTQIASSIKEFGFNVPVLIDKSMGIIAGHGRVEAAKKLKMTEVPCLRLEHLTETQKKAYILADNRIALNSTWDEELLGLEMMALQDEGFELKDFGFSESDIKKLFNDEIQEGTEEKVNSVFEIVVECINELEQEKMFKEFTERGLKCRVLSM